MRLLFGLSLLGLCAACFAAAPPAKVPAEWLNLIDALGDDDAAVRKAAEKKLTALGEDALPPLRRAAKGHSDPDVRIQARIVLRAIEKLVYVEVRNFAGHKEPVICVAVSPDGKRAVSGSGRVDGYSAARVWDLSTGKELLQLEGTTNYCGASALAWSQDGKRILSGGGDNTIRLWDASTGKQLKKMTGHRHHVTGVAFTPDGKKAITCGDEKTVRIWDLETGKQIASNADHGEYGSGLRGLAMMPDGKSFASCGYDGTVRIIGLDGRQVRKIDALHQGVWCVAVSPDGKTIAAGGFANAFRLFDARTGKMLKEFEGHTSHVQTVAFSPDGRRVLSASTEGSAIVWDVASGEKVQHLAGQYDRPVWCAAFVGDGFALTGGRDKEVRLWKVRQ